MSDAYFVELLSRDLVFLLSLYSTSPQVASIFIRRYSFLPGGGKQYELVSISLVSLSRAYSLAYLAYSDALL